MNKLYFCEGIKCKNRISLMVEGELADTCSISRCPPDEKEGCPYSKDFVRGWYKGQEITLERLQDINATLAQADILVKGE